MEEVMYLVIANDLFIGYGSYVYFIGIFNSREKAEEAVLENTVSSGGITVEPKIIEIPVNSTYYIKYDKTFERLDGDILLGGYEE